MGLFFSSSQGLVAQSVDVFQIINSGAGSNRESFIELYIKMKLLMMFSIILFVAFIVQKSSAANIFQQYGSTNNKALYQVCTRDSECLSNYCAGVCLPAILGFTGDTSGVGQYCSKFVPCARGTRCSNYQCKLG